MLIRQESPADHPSVAALHAAAFGGDRVPRLVTALRAAGERVGLVAEVDGAVAGHVLLSWCLLDAPRRLVDVLTLSPLGVLPRAQRRGIGTALVRAALRAAADAQSPLVFLEGAPDYYGPRGFQRADLAGFRSPSLRIPPAAFQVALLAGYQPWMTGTWVYSAPFWAHDAVGLRD